MLPIPATAKASKWSHLYEKESAYTFMTGFNDWF